jgi:hypothetical protein
MDIREFAKNNLKTINQMKKTILFFLFISIHLLLSAQQKAITSTGEEVVLNTDGTWAYLPQNEIRPIIPINTTKFKKGKTSSFLLKSNKLNIGFWLDPSSWVYKKGLDNQDAEYVLQLKNEDLYGMIITETVEIPLASMKSIALENGRSIAPDLKVVKEEYRNVNGLKVLLLQMNGTMEGIKFSYYGYYFSNKNGTLQFITYTSENLVNSYQNTCEDLLNGLVMIEE